MKKIVWAAACMSFLTLSAQTGVAQEQTVRMHVSGMTCGVCPISIRHRAMQMNGVHAASVDLEQASATVTFEDKTQSAQAIAHAISKLGYPATIQGVQP